MRNANIVTTIRLARAARCGWPPATLRGGEANIMTFIPATDWIYIVSILTVFIVLVK